MNVCVEGLVTVQQTVYSNDYYAASLLMMSQTKNKRGRKLRTISDSFFVAAPTRMIARTRFYPSPTDEKVLRAVGDELSRLEGWALKRRCQMGSAFSKEQRAAMKRELTARGLTARQAGSIVGRVMSMWRARRQAQLRELRSLTQRISTIESKLKQHKTNSAYHSPAVYFQKTRKLEILKERRQRLREEYRAGCVKIVRGSRDLLAKRHHLLEAEISEEQWRDLWESKRRNIAFAFAGEAWKLGGNETLRITENGQLELRLPNSLAGLGDDRSRYTFFGSLRFTHHQDQWRRAHEGKEAIQYQVIYEPGKGRWYLEATFKAVACQRPPTLDTGRVVGVDLNADHLAVWCKDKYGNPLGRPIRVPLKLLGLPASTRDARLRFALSAVIAYAKRMNAYQVAIEDLGFTEDFQDSKEKVSKRFRQTVHDIPTAKLRARASAMFAHAGLQLIAVDPAYTSKWAAPWAQALNVSKHEAAALMISLRAKGQKGSRKRHKPSGKQSIALGHLCVQPRQFAQDAGLIPMVQEVRRSSDIRPHCPMPENGRSTREQDRSVSGAVSEVHVPLRA